MTVSETQIKTRGAPPRNSENTKTAHGVITIIMDYAKEYYSEKIAEILYHKENNTKELIELAEEKAKYFRTKKIQQGRIKF